MPPCVTSAGSAGSGHVGGACGFCACLRVMDSTERAALGALTSVSWEGVPRREICK